MVHRLTVEDRSARIVRYLTLAVVGFGSVRLLIREWSQLLAGGSSLRPTYILVALIVVVWMVAMRKKRRRNREEWRNRELLLWESRHNGVALDRYADILNDIPPL